jgi:signal transduction histidine kinase
MLVSDDGKGFDPATTPKGSGLQGIADRLGALGGTIAITRYVYRFCGGLASGMSSTG